MVLTCIDSVLDDLEWLENNKGFTYPVLKEALRFFRTFLVCAKSWSSDVYLESDNDDGKLSLGSFLLSIEDTIQRNAPDIQPLSVQLTDDASSHSILLKEISSFWKKIELFMPRIKQVYITFSDCLRESGSSFEHDELVRFIESLLDNLVDLIVYVKYGCLSYPEELFAGLEEHLRFVKNFIRFATWQGVEKEQLKDLFAHFELVAFDAARLAFMSWIEVDQEEEIANGLESLKLMEPQVCQTCIKVLKASKLSGSPHRHERNDNIVVDFMDSLLDKLWELLNCSSSFAASVKYEMKILYEGLNFFRTILKEQLEKFDGLHESLSDLLGAAVNESGIAIFSLFLNKMEEESGKEVDHALSDLLEHVEIIKAEAVKKYPETSRFYFPRTKELTNVNSLLENLQGLVRSDIDSVSLAKEQIQIVQNNLEFLKCYMEDIVEQQNEPEELQALWSRVMEVAYKVESAKDIPGCSVMLLKSITEEIELIKTEALVAKTSRHLTSEVRKLTINKVVTGSSDEAKTIIDQLIGGPTELDTVCIVDAPGSGKTTLAKRIYVDTSIVCHFDVRAWCTVSHEYQKKILFLDILGGILDELPDQFYEMEENDLAEQLCKLLKRNRYLIVLDDVWMTDTWDDLGKLLPNESNGSRILLISRLDSVALQAKPNSKPHSIHPLTEEESWELMQKLLGIVVGFDDEAETIIGHLTRGSNQLDIVSIVGMPGLGKTTLAKKVYDDPEIVNHFHVRAWCSVSQKYYKRNLLIDILGDILGDLPNRFYKMDEDDLVEQLYKLLKKKRYLIVLDDVWDTAVWNDLEKIFPDDGEGSRILFTSRARDVALHAKSDGKLHLLRSLTDGESCELLQKKLFLTEGCPPALSELVRQIAEKCQGLPLTIVIVSGILKTIEQDRWMEVAETLAFDVCGTDQCMNTLELSYKYLPDHLKPCYLYFGAFPEDQEILTCRLVWLWMAEGFVKQNEGKSLENVAEGYITDLAGRSLVTIATERFTGGIKTCRIHDLLREFCVAKSKKEKFWQLLNTYDELYTFTAPGNLPRLCIYSERIHFEKSRLFCPNVRTLLFFPRGDEFIPNSFNISFIFWIFTHLRVLDIGEINVGDVFPGEVQLLVRLRYLAIMGRMLSIPSSIANLLNLETFIVTGLHDSLLLPDTIWNMTKLRHLQVNGFLVGFSLPIDNLETSSVSYNLDTFGTILLPFGQSMEKILRKFPNIRKLKCVLFEPEDSCEDYNMIMDSQLESLNLSQIYVGEYPVHFSFPLTLKKLTLSKFLLPWSKISMIAKLPNLVVLKLLDRAFQGEEWEMAEGEFPKLKFLKLESLNIVRWTFLGDEFPPLQKLVLERCLDLEEVPCCFEDISTLEMIEVRRCRRSAERLVKKIEKEQRDMGNEDLKIILEPLPWWDDMYSQDPY